MPILGLTWARPRDLDSKVSAQFDYVTSSRNLLICNEFHVPIVDIK
jgi:hypothetical protein